MLLTVGAARAATSNVSVVDNSFQPQQLTVTVGDTVMWTDNGNNPHTVTADGGAFDSSNGGSGTMANGQTFSHTFTAAGSFPYHCKIHGAAGGLGMAGTIVVQAAASSTTTSTSTTSTTAAPPSTSTTTTTSTTRAHPTTTSTTTATGTPATVAAVQATTTTAAVAGRTLPFTGSRSTALALVGLCLVGLGVTTVVSASRRRR